MPDSIHVRGLSLLGKHGVYDFEKQNAQPFIVDLVLYVDLKAAGASDDLSDTVSYVDVIERVKDIVENKSFSLIEKLADAIATSALSDARISEVDVTVRKPNAAVGALIDDVAVAIHRP